MGKALDKILKIFGIIFIALLVIVAAVALRIHYAGSIRGCDKTEPQSVASPDKKWTAVQIFQTCGGAIGSVYSQAELRSADGNSTLVFDAEGASLEFKWLDAQHLQIKYPRTSGVLKKKDSVDGVTITYVTDPPS